MEIVQIDPALIEPGKRLRAVDPDRVAFLAETISRRGLDTPIQVAGPDSSGFYKLLAGAHRLSATVQVGLETIPAIVRTGSEDELKLVEIEENLIRNELNELDRATFLAEHQAIYQRLYPATKHGGDRKSDGRKKSSPQAADLIEHPLVERFSAYTARKIGLSEDTIHRAIRRFKHLPETVRDRIAGTWLSDNGSALDALIGPKGAERGEDVLHELLDILLATEGGTRNVGEAVRRWSNLPPADPSDAILRRLSGAWWKTPHRQRQDAVREWLKDDATRIMVRSLLAEPGVPTSQDDARLAAGAEKRRAG